MTEANVKVTVLGSVLVALIALAGVVYSSFNTTDIESKKFNYSVKCKDFIAVNQNECKKHSKAIELNGRAIEMLESIHNASNEDRDKLTANIKSLMRSHPDVDWQPYEDRASELKLSPTLTIN